VLPDYNTTRAALRLSDSYTASNLCCSCYAKNNLEPASKSNNLELLCAVCLSTCSCLFFDLLAGSRLFLAQQEQHKLEAV
jgi:hypothetical protein